LRRSEAQRKAREDRMRNALEILAEYDPAKQVLWGDIRRFVRATAREGLGREPTPRHALGREFNEAMQERERRRERDALGLDAECGREAREGHGRE
jgi:hypothetical protein